MNKDISREVGEMSVEISHIKKDMGELKKTVNCIKKNTDSLRWRTAGFAAGTSFTVSIVFALVKYGLIG